MTDTGKPFNYAEWVAAPNVPQPFEQYQMFACDWVPVGATHEEGVEACIVGIMGHERNANPDDIRQAVLSWGYLGREDE